MTKKDINDLALEHIFRGDYLFNSAKELFNYEEKPDFSQKIIDSDYYPIILVPEKINFNIKKKILDSEIYKKKGLKEPIYRPISLPDKPLPYYVKEETKTKYIGVSFFALLPFVLLFVLFVTKETFFFFAIIALVLFYKIIKDLNFVEKYTVYENINLEKGVYEKHLNNYENKKKEIEVKNSILKKNYEDEMAKLDSLLTPNEKRKIELSIFYESLQPNSLTMRNTMDIRRGKSELMFLNELYNEFGEQIKMDITPENSPYFPDFTLVCKTTGLHIDIEIDEPYSYGERKPIHYVESEDPIRNVYFLDSNWCVLRFSEKQIITQTKQCVNLIKNFIDSITNKTLNFRHNVEKERKWTYEESLVMVFNNQRDNYK